jgi:hypothetical protein
MQVFGEKQDYRDGGQTMSKIEILANYARMKGFNVNRREDGTFYLTSDKGKPFYSVIHDHGQSFETWNYSRGMRGCHRCRNAESVKRTLRRLATS